MVAAERPVARPWTFEEAEELERRLERKLEFIDGAVYAMSDGSPEHHKLVVELLGQLHAQLMRGPDRGRCRPFPSDAKIRVREPQKKNYRYPDLSVFCGEPERHPDTSSLFINPKALFEVTSDSTERIDTGAKLDEYREIESLVAYVIVSQTKTLITIHERAQTGWITSRFTEGLVAIPGVPAHIDVEELYAALA